MRNLPQPTGKYKIGFVDGCVKYKLKDEERILGYRLFYPSDKTEGTPAKYLTKDMAECMFSQGGREMPEYVKYWQEMDTHCFENAPISNDAEKFDVVIHQPPHGGMAWNNLIIIEELVSCGYVVMGFSHPGECSFNFTGDGYSGIVPEILNIPYADFEEYLAKCEDKEVINWNKDQIKDYLINLPRMAERLNVWASDTIEMMDFIESLNKDKSSIFYGRLKCDGYGLFGHSFGGATSMQTTIRDSRVKAAVNLDGWLFGAQLLDKKTNSPMLMITRQEPSLEANFGINKDVGEAFILPNCAHNMYSDGGYIAEEFFNNVDVYPGTIKGEELNDILTETVKTYFNIHIKNDNTVSLQEIADKHPTEIKYVKIIK